MEEAANEGLQELAGTLIGSMLSPHGASADGGRADRGASLGDATSELGIDDGKLRGFAQAIRDSGRIVVRAGRVRLEDFALGRRTAGSPERVRERSGDVIGELIRELIRDMLVFSADYAHGEGNVDLINLYEPRLSNFDASPRDRFLGENIAAYFARMGDPITR